MPSKLFYSLLLCLILLACYPDKVKGQVLSLSIKSNAQTSALSFNQANWETATLNGANTAGDSFSFSKGLLGVIGTGVLPKVMLKAQSAYFTYTPVAGVKITNVVPADVLRTEITGVTGSDGLTSLLSSILSASHPVTLSTTDKQLFDGLANVALNLFGSDRPVTLKYTVSQAGVKQFLKAAGTYTLDLLYTGYSALGVPNGTANVTLTIDVAPFTLITGLQNVPRLKFSQAADYSNGPQASPVQQLIDITSTVPYQIQLITAYSNFLDQDNASQPVMLVSHIQTQAGAMGGNASPIPALSTTAKPLLSGTSAFQNTESIVYRLPAQYTSAYLRTGTYRSPLNFTVIKYDGTTETVTTDLFVDVSPIAQLSITGPVDLKFLNAEHYRRGIHTDMLAHLHVDKNSPYEIYAKAAGSTLDGTGGSISLNNLIAIEPLAQSGALSGSPHRVTLSSSYQAIITGAEPAMNKDIALRYIIEAANTGRLINKPAGMYSTTVIYSFTAQ